MAKVIEVEMAKNVSEANLDSFVVVLALCRLLLLVRTAVGPVLRAAAVPCPL